MSHLMGYIYSTCILSQPVRTDHAENREVALQPYGEARQEPSAQSAAPREVVRPLGVNTYPGRRID